jgi:beta-lactamase regulating signal transducer with metallopeptidase domain
MGDLFVSVLNMSISAAWVLLAVLILRLIFKKAPKRITVLLWCIVGLRLIMPFSVESIFSLIPSSETVSKAWDSPRPNLNSGITVIDNGVNNYLEGHYFEGVTRPAGHFTDITTIAAAAWLIGTAALLIYTAVSFFRLKKGLRTAVLLRDNIFQSEKISSPFVFGIIKPKIYLPFGITERNAESVILHEQAHISRRDYLWKPLGFLLLCVHWFNPLMWLAYILFCRDIEFACDERAIGLLNADKRADYSEALLNCSAGRHMLFAYPPAFGEVGVKSRVKSVLNYKKPAFWLAAAAVIAGIAASVCLLTSPKTGSSRSDSLVIRDCIVEDGCEGIGYKLVSSTYEKNNISIRVKWTNKRKEELYFGEEFKLFKTDGDTACTQKKTAGFDAAANIISPGGSKTEIYNLSDHYDIEPGVQYRLEKTFYLKSDNDKKYKAYIVFKAGEALAEYMPEKAAYTEPSSDYTNDNIPQFKVDNFSFSLLKKEPASSEWEKIDGLQSVRLKKSEFDKSFSGGVWTGDLSAQKLRRDNLHAFTAFNTDGSFYYLLEQKNGDVYIAKGSQLSEDFPVNWLFKMKRTDENGNMSLGELQNAVYPSGGSNRQEQ